MTSEMILNPAGWRDAPYIEQWLGIWAMREAEFSGLALTMKSLNLSVHLAGPEPQAAVEAAAESRRRSYAVEDNVAVLELRGRMQKHSTSMGGGASTVALRRAVRQAANDADVGAILLLIDSPGGTVSGTSDLAADVAAAAKQKPLIAFIEDLGASAAYWVGSQAPTLLAGPTAAVGSIGTYGVVHDMSALAAKEGIKVHVVRAGAMKGAGTPGTEVTPEQLADFQREVDQLNEFFLAGVASGRKGKLSLDQVRTLADGRVWIGKEAVDKGLLDGVASFDQAFATARKSAKQWRRTMAAATYSEIVAACPGATNDFICDQLKAGATVEQSVKDFMAHQQLQLEQLRKDRDAAATLAENNRKALEAAQNKPGVAPLTMAAPATGAGATEAAGSAWEDFQAAIDAKVKAGMPRAKAVSAAVRENSERHKAALAEYNQQHGASRRSA